MSKNLTKNLGELNGSFQSYVKAKIDLAKLSLLGKTARFLSSLLSFFIVLVFSMLIIGFAATAFAVWYGEEYGSYVNGLLISGGALVLLASVFILIGRKIVTNSVIKNFSEILFDENEENRK